MKSVFQNIKDDQLVSVYCDTNCPNTHLTGFIGAIFDDDVIVRHISKEGLYDGFIMIRTSDVFRVDLGGEYENKILALYTIKKQSHPMLSFGDSSMETLLNFCIEESLVLSLELLNCTLTGFVLDFDETKVHLQLVDLNGRKNGETFVMCDEIVSFAADTSTEQDIRCLYYETNGQGAT